MSGYAKGAGHPRQDEGRNRELRRLAFETIMQMAEDDETLAGATLFLPDGSIEFVDATTLRRGGRA